MESIKSLSYDMFAINTTSTMKYIKPLFLLASSWAIIPPYDFENYKIIYGRKYKILRSFVIIYLIVGFIYAFVEKILYIQPLLHSTVVVVDYLAFISYFLINILTVFSTNFYNFDNLKKMLDILANIDKTLTRYHEDNAKSNKTCIKIELFASFAILSCAMVFDYVLWSRAASVAIIQFSTVYSNTQRIQTHITMHVVCNFIACIRRGYRDANSLLEDVVTKKGIIKLMDKFTVNKFKSDYTVKDVIRIYIGLNKMIDCINKLYGWTLLCLNINIISTLLLSFDFIIEYTADTNVLREKNGISFIFLMLIWSILSLVSIL